SGDQHVLRGAEVGVVLDLAECGVWTGRRSKRGDREVHARGPGGNEPVARVLAAGEDRLKLLILRERLIGAVIWTAGQIVRDAPLHRTGRVEEQHDLWLNVGGAKEIELIGILG